MKIKSLQYLKQTWKVLIFHKIDLLKKVKSKKKIYHQTHQKVNPEGIRRIQSKKQDRLHLRNTIYMQMEN